MLPLRSSEVQVGAEGVAGVAHGAEQRGLVDSLAERHRDLVEVGIDGSLAVRVLEHDPVPVPAGAPRLGADHLAGCGRDDRVADDVGPVPVDRVAARAVALTGRAGPRLAAGERHLEPGLRCGRGTGVPEAAGVGRVTDVPGDRRTGQAEPGEQRARRQARQEHTSHDSHSNLTGAQAPQGRDHRTSGCHRLSGQFQNYSGVIGPSVRGGVGQRSRKGRISPSWAALATSRPSGVNTRAQASPRAPWATGDCMS